MAPSAGIDLNRRRSGSADAFLVALGGKGGHRQHRNSRQPPVALGGLDQVDAERRRHRHQLMADPAARLAPMHGRRNAMLGEGHRRAERGTDVVVGLVETHDRRHTAAGMMSPINYESTAPNRSGGEGPFALKW
mgnify:CR=1 FL=1